MDSNTLTECQWSTLTADEYFALLADVLSPPVAPLTWFAVTACQWASLTADQDSALLADLPPLPSLSDNPAYNMSPMVTINGKNLGRTSRIDAMTTKFANVQTFEGPVWIELVSPYANSVIRYETNEKTPCHLSKLYTAPLTFWKNGSRSDRTVIKARIYDVTNVNLYGRIIWLEFNVI